jgi:hypothetical protein
MPRCAAGFVEWKNRCAYRLSNGTVELTALLGGGHLADFRLCGSPINAIWEAPWPTIEPQTFSSREHAELYGEGPAGKLLCGYTGQALALAYFGMPSAAEAAKGLALHGEAASSEWKVVSAEADDSIASLVLEVALPNYRLKFRREITIFAGAYTVAIHEMVENLSDAPLHFQWVEHATFGEPLFTNGEATLFLSGARGVTWHLGYEGHELLPNDTEFHWPLVHEARGGPIDLSSPFAKDGTGFVASVLTNSDRMDAFVAVHNRKHVLVAGYLFDRTRFPWIALWEENHARPYAPWNGRTRVRGVEFGTSPMPLGLEQARKMRTLFDTPVFTSVAENATIETRYEMFVARAPSSWKRVTDVAHSGGSLFIRGDNNQEIQL